MKLSNDTSGNLLTHILLLYSLNVENYLFLLRRPKHAAWKGWYDQIVSESLLLKLMQAEEYIYHTELCFNNND
jgi:hypothetical protein